MPFEASLNLKEQKLTFFSKSAVIYMSETLKGLLAWTFLANPSYSHLGDCFSFILQLLPVIAQLQLFPVAESAGFHPIVLSSEGSPNVWIMTLPPSYLFLSGFCFWSSLLCFHSTSPPSNLIPQPACLLTDYLCWFVCMYVHVCIFHMSHRVFLSGYRCTFLSESMCVLIDFRHVLMDEWAIRTPGPVCCSYV